jgi:hypothetical protein
MEQVTPFLPIIFTVLSNVAMLAYFLAKLSIETRVVNEKINDIRTRFEAHANDRRTHQDTKTQEIQLQHIDKRLTSLEGELKGMRESVTQRIDDLHKTIIEGQ